MTCVHRPSDSTKRSKWCSLTGLLPNVQLEASEDVADHGVIEDDHFRVFRILRNAEETRCSPAQEADDRLGKRFLKLEGERTCEKREGEEIHVSEKKTKSEHGCMQVNSLDYFK